jgi:YebC/PmpR family DNA-binding regulatory protein
VEEHPPAQRQGRSGARQSLRTRLRLAIEKARENSMPADNIKRAIQKGTGELEGASYEEVTYEGYGPGGAAVLVEVATDNRNRTVAELRHLFSKHGGNLGESGSVAWQFSHKGMIMLSATEYSEDAVMEAALEAGAEDVRREGDSFEIVTTFEDLANVRGELESRGITIESAQAELLPQTTIDLEGDAARRMLKLMDALEDHDDVQKVAANFDIAESLLEEAER